MVMYADYYSTGLHITPERAHCPSHELAHGLILSAARIH